MSTRRKTLLAVVMVPLAMVLTLGSIAIASAHPAGNLATQSDAARHRPRIVISMLTFTVPAHVRPGVRITVVNKDAFLHSVTADDGTSFGKDVPASSRVTIRAPMTPGSYPFHCRIHATMHATLVVQAP